MTDVTQSRAARLPTTRFGLWLHGARPQTLVISLAPVIVGAAYAWGLAERFAAGPVAAAALSAVAIQVATNLANDAADAASGVDGPGRAGPPRLAGSGVLSARTVRLGALVATLVAAAFGLIAVLAGGWPILAIGLASILAGWTYSFGPRPISASPLGEVFVIVFFGVLAVSGIVWLGARQWDATALLLGLAIGLPAGAVLTANNHRDRELDARAGRRTLAIRLGPQASVWLYGAQVTGASLIAALALAPLTGAGAGLVALTGLGGLWMTARFARTPVSPALSRRLAETAQAGMALALLIAAVLVIRP